MARRTEKRALLSQKQTLHHDLYIFFSIIPTAEVRIASPSRGPYQGPPLPYFPPA